MNPKDAQTQTEQVILIRKSLKVIRALVDNLGDPDDPNTQEAKELIPQLEELIRRQKA